MQYMIDLIIDNFRAIVGFILGSVFGYYIQGRINRETRVAEASAKFRAATLQAFSGLYPIPVNWPSGNGIDTHLRTIFPDLQIAIAEFRPFVPWWRRHDFDEAWFRYHCSTGREIDAQVYHHYRSFSDQPDPKVTCICLASHLQWNQ